MSSVARTRPEAWVERTSKALPPRPVCAGRRSRVAATLRVLNPSMVAPTDSVVYEDAPRVGRALTSFEVRGSGGGHLLGGALEVGPRQRPVDLSSVTRDAQERAGDAI